jgi:hypothetical protein
MSVVMKGRENVKECMYLNWFIYAYQKIIFCLIIDYKKSNNHIIIML